jgi:uncharacterized protein (DUF697 family)
MNAKPIEDGPADDLPTKRRLRGHEPKRVIGYRGDRIVMHRAMRRLSFPLTRWIDVLGIPLALTAGYCALWPTIASLWERIIGFWSVALEGQVRVATVKALVPGFGAIPYPHSDAALPTAVQWLVGMIVTLALLFGTRFIGGRALPLAYWLRFIGVVQASAQFYFFMWPASFPYDGGGSIGSLTQASVVVVLITPWLYALIYNVLDFGLIRKLVLSVMGMAYLTVFIPFQYTLASVVLLKGSMLWYPQIFLLWAVFLQFGTLVGFYAWAMSWNARGSGGQRLT